MKLTVTVTADGWVFWRRPGWSLASEGLWIIVAVFFLCTALGLSINTNLNAGNNLSSARAATEQANAANRIYNQTAIAVCLIFLVIATTRAGWHRRTLRVLRTPIVWAIGYQLIIAWHYWSDGNVWDLARLCGVWVLLMVAMAASVPMTMERYMPKMLLLFRLLLWISVLIAVVLPDNAWELNYLESFIPGIQNRFAGVGGHANGMGAIAGIAVLMELDQLLGHGSKRWLSVLHLGLGGALLVLTQSKTSLLACAICGVYLMLCRKKRGLPLALRVLIVAGTVLICSVLAWSFLSDWVVSNQDSLSDLTGRVSLWKYYWSIGINQPWFGYGRALWSEFLDNEAFQYRWAAGNAHNQLLNSFLLAGVFGVACLLGYVAGFFRARRRITVRNRALFIACLGFMVIRSFTEAGFEPGDLSVVAMIQVVLIGFCLCRPGRRSVVRLTPVRRMHRGSASSDREVTVLDKKSMIPTNLRARDESCSPDHLS